MDIFVISLVSSFVATFVMYSAKTLAKRLFSDTQKPLPNTPTNVTVVVVFVVYLDT